MFNIIIISIISASLLVLFATIYGDISFIVSIKLFIIFFISGIIIFSISKLTFMIVDKLYKYINRRNKDGNKRS